MAVQGVVQNAWRTILARVYSRDVTQAQAEFVRFKIGEGGSSGGLPITPDETFTDLEGEGSPLASGGTVQFTNGSAFVDGVGTNFVADLTVGDWIKPGPQVSASPYSAGVPGTEYDWWGEVRTIHAASGVGAVELQVVYAGATNPAGRACHRADEPLYVFRKDLVAGDVLFNSVLPAITEITCTVAAVEANSDQLGNTPEFFELGIFDSNGVMMGYLTFDKQEKIAGVQLVTIGDLVF